MNKLQDGIQKARSDAQELHQNIESTMAKDDAAARASFQSAAGRAHELSSSLKVLAVNEASKAKQHLNAASSSLEGVAKHAQAVASATGGELKQDAKAALARAHDAVQSLSAAVAAKRSTAKV